MSAGSVLRWSAVVVAALTLGSEVRAQAPTVAADVVGGVVGAVRGRFQGEVSPLPYAVVEAVSAGVRRAAVADDEGRYTLTGLTAGEVRLSVSHVGYEPLTLTVTVPASDSVTIDLELAAVPVSLPGVDVVGSAAIGAGVPSSDRADSTIPELDLQALEIGPGVSQPGLADVVAALPGNDPGDATDILFMRGSTADLKLVLLDGVPVYTPFHVAGLMKSFEPGVLGTADLHVGGAPARFDGGLTNILDLRTRSARKDRVRASGSIDFLAASAAVEAPLGGRAGIIMSGRSLHGLGDTPLGGSPPYGYRDALLAASIEPASGHELRTTGFWNEESVVLDADLAPSDARWSNRAGSFGYRADVGSGRVELTAGMSEYRARLPLQPSAQPGQPLPPALLAAAATDRLRIVGEATWGAVAAPVRAGLSFERMAEDFTAHSVSGTSSAASRGSARTLGAFLDVTRPIAQGLSLRAGVRADHFSGGGTRLAPRAQVSWAIGPEALVTVAAGRYHQPTRASDAQVDQSLEAFATADASSPGRLPVATSDHVVLSLDQRVARTVRMDLQGFWKSYNGLPAATRESVRSSGVDVRIVTAGDDRAAWLGYGLSWYWSTVNLSGRASEFVGRHLLSAGVSGRLVGPLRAEARVAYGGGLPYTSIPFSGAPAYNSLPAGSLSTVSAGRATDEPLVDGLDETFLRLDLEVHAVLEPTWGGRPWRIRPYVRVLNALDRRDAMFYTFQPWRSAAAEPLAERPVLPVLGVAFSF